MGGLVKLSCARDVGVHADVGHHTPVQCDVKYLPLHHTLVINSARLPPPLLHNYIRASLGLILRVSHHFLFCSPSPYALPAVTGIHCND